jgi:hypothetical protein
MNSIVASRNYRLAAALLVGALLAGCGPSEDKSKKAEPAPPPPAPPKVTPPPAAKPPVPKTEPAKPAPKAEVKPALKADAEGWFLLGTQQADRRGERERVEVGRGLALRELRVTVQGAPLAISEMIVTFGNDKQFKPSLRPQFDANTNQVIDLPGDKRAIKYVDFVYRTAASGTGKATVLLHGR